jgi:molybdopterin converting factor small subunit
MKVKIETLALPMLAEVFGSKNLKFEFQGATVADLLDALRKAYGKKLEKVLFERKADKSIKYPIDPTMQILVDGRAWVNRDNVSTPLRDGSVVVFMLLAGGG